LVQGGLTRIIEYGERHATGSNQGCRRLLTLQQKQEMIRKVTDAVLSVEGEGLRAVTWVTIEDVQPDAWGVGGTPVTDDDLRKMADSKSAV
jgi:4-oxalocrotonate tautomerase